MTHFQLFIIFCVILCGVAADIKDQPQLYVVDNNVHFRVPPTGYMKFTVSSLKVNDVDLIPTLEEAQNAAKLLRNYELFISQYQSKMDDIESKLGNIGYVSGGNTTNATDVSSLFATRIFRLNRRIFTLQRSIRNLQLLLTKNECASNPCKNGAVCLDIFNGFMCQCPSGWEGATCEKDVNECARFIGTDLGCQNGASCLNLPGTYQCQCPVGWIGIHCNRKPTDCNSGGPEICGHGTCIPQNNEVGYKCLCDQGWTTDGTHLTCSVDVDECKQNHPPCSTNPLVQCINLPGSFMCQHCPPGYTGNGYYCADINECELFNGGCSVSPYVECINTPGSKKCGPCPAGYEGDGKTCTFKGVCHVNNGGCSFLATCVNNPAIAETNVQCLCPAGYRGSGIGPMGCVKTSSSACSPNPCVHGHCVPNNSTKGFECICDSQFTGMYCDQRDNLCTPNPCQNGATCLERRHRFVCICAGGYSGRFCQRERQACGEVFEAPNGTLSYPPIDYVSLRRTEGLSCTWTIKTEEDKVVEINFTRFNLAPSCGTQWLQVHDGRNNLAPMLGKFCGNTLPFNGSFVSTRNVVYFWLRTDGQSDLKPTFELSWRTRNPVCGGKITGDQGLIVSPGWPNNYPNNRNCYWRFSLPVEKRLSFHVYSLNIGQNADCTADYLEFYSDRVSTISQKQLFAKLCNSTIPETFYSLSHSGYVHFTSNEKDSYAGFQIGYTVENAIQGCGGTYTNTDGYIQSIVMTSTMPSPLVCEYEIKLAANTTIELEIVELDMEDSCDETYVAIYQELASDTALVGRYCGKTLPGMIVTYGKSIIIKSETKYLNRGHWKIKYKTVCHQMFTKPNGTITNSAAGRRTECRYLIAQPPGAIILLELEVFQIRRFYFGIMPSVYVFDGDNENATLVGKYQRKATVESTANYLLIKTVKDRLSRIPLFTATYTTVDLGCGGLLKDDMGSISYPPHGEEQYLPNKNCKWIIMAPPGKIVQLTWMIFNLEQSFDCTYDNVQVFDNNTGPGMGGLIGKYCGYSLPPTVLSSSNIMTISFVSDNSKHGDGFLVSYTFIKENNVCGGNYFTSAGVLKSPGYPQNYPIDRVCVWTITVTPGSQIMLKFTNFTLESYSGCRYDWLELRNGGTSSSPLIGKYCGTTYPKQITSHTNKLYLKFNSDNSKSNRGFRIEWSSAATGCGGTLTSPSGSIMSPLYPEPYSKNTDCQWKITVSAGSKIQIIFADIDLEKHTSCGLDYVQLFDGPTLNSKSLGTFCSSQTNPVISTNNNMLVRFKSDVSLQGRGFNLQYSTVCINKMNGFRGVIESPNFPNDYPQDQNCVWDISVAEGNKINISFSHFALERSTTLVNKSCSFDYVEIEYAFKTQYHNEEDEPEWEKYDRYCGDRNPGLITLPSNQAKIHFVSDSLLLGAGFRLEWQLFGCGGILTETEGIIQSPNYPKPYRSNIQCNWLINVPLGRSIYIEFKEIDVEKDGSCRYDYLEVFNGKDENYQQIAKFCHQLSPITVTASGNNMFIVFKADYSNDGRGFNATYGTAPTTCGGLMTAPDGFIFSPNYPKNFNKNETCEWLIRTDENHVIEMKFDDVDLTNLGNCNNTYIKVYDGPTQAYPVLDTICGSSIGTNRTIRSTYENMFIEFRSDYYFTSKGFKAHYWKACGAKIKTSGSGQIQLSRLFDFSIYGDTTVNCSFTIESEDRSKHVTLTITKFELGSSSWCGEDSAVLKIFDGYFSDSTPIGSYCPPKLPAPIISEGSALHIEVYQELGLFATYSVLDDQCGGDLQSQEGYLATPGWPKSYPKDLQCVWVISMGPGNTISLTFNELDIPESEKCNSDFVEIRETNETGKLLNVFCGKETPPTISVVGTLYVIFKSSQLEEGTESTHKGFIAEYATNTDNHLNGSEGYIGNLGYPNPFPSSSVQSMSWSITTNSSTVIELTFLEFAVDTVIDTACYGNVLKVYDGMDSSATLLNELCGVTLPNSIITTSNMMYITLDVYNSRVDSKFLLKWKELTKKKVQSKQTQSECQYFSKLEGQTTMNITSPGYPHGYAPLLHCEWVYEIDPQYHLAVEFKNLDFGRWPILYDCKYTDTLKLYTKREKKSEWELLKVICNSTNLEEKIEASSLLKVEFDSDRFINGTGFKGVVYGVCGGSLTGPSGKIEFDKDHAYGNTCQWNITVRAGRTIKLNFDQFDLSPNDPSSCKNFLVIRNGMFPDSPFLGNGKFCGPAAPPELESTSNHVYLKYSGRSAIQRFKIRYSEVSFDCGGEFRLTPDEDSIEISSPNYPNIPQHHIECVWRFSAPSGEAIRVDFEERFDISRDHECTTDYLELRDGGTEVSPLIGRFCDETPSTKFSTDNMLTVKYFTESDEPRNGFKAKVSLSYCGGTIRGQGTINTKELHTIREGSNCTWYLKAPANYYIVMHFPTFHVSRYATNCNRDLGKVTIFERNPISDVEKDKHLGTFCGQLNTTEIRSTSNTVVVNYLAKNDQDEFRLDFKSEYERCGGTLVQETGTITSPGYTNMYSRSQYCSWKIQVPKGRRISIFIVDLDIDTTTTFVYIYNGYSLGPRIAGPRNIEAGRTYETSDNKANIIYWQDFSSSKRGFKMVFTSEKQSVCAYNLNTTSGVVSVPETSSPYICEYEHSKIINEETLALQIALETNRTVKSLYKRCIGSLTGIRIYGGNEVVGVVCQNTNNKPLIFRSTHSVTKLLVAKHQYTSLNYTVDFKTHKCGGMLRNNMGNISSPNFPSTPSDSVECSWIITLEESGRIKINFTNFDLGEECDKSSLVIYNGKTSYDAKIGTYCGNLKPDVIISQRNYLLIEYRYEKGGNSPKKGFRLNYESEQRGCGGLYQIDKKFIESPNYKKGYGNNEECVWEVRAAEGNIIKLNFFDRFHIEESDNCTKDYVEVFDWKNEKWISLGKMCGRNLPQGITSSGNQLKILFRTNENVTGAGFRASWSWHCGGVLEADKKESYLTSPYYPFSLLYRANCTYRIETKSQYGIVGLRFLDFELGTDTDSNCRIANLTITGQRLLMKQVFCGKDIAQYQRYTHGVTIIFMNDARRYNTASGFKLAYKDESCGGNITAPTILESPRSDVRLMSGIMKYYQPRIECTWYVTAPSDQVVVLRIHKLGMSIGRSCLIRALNVYDGPKAIENKKLASLCGKLQEPTPIPSRSNQMVIKLYTPPYDFDGFQGEVYFTYGPSVGCGGTINLTETKQIKSPNNLPHMECHWIIIAPQDYKVKLEFKDISISTSCINPIRNHTYYCTCSYVEIRDGGGPFADQMAKLCSSDNNSVRTFTTSWNTAYVKLYSAVPQNDMFQLTLTPMQSKCGPSILTATKEFQELTSPDYPNNYPEDLKCTWVVQKSTIGGIMIHFEDFDLPEESPARSCDTDRLELTEDPNQLIISEGFGPGARYTNRGFYVNSPQDFKYVFCGNDTKPFDYYSTKNRVTLTLYSMLRNGKKGRGFKLKYATSGCNRTIYANEGNIQNQIPDNDPNCVITIVADPNRFISIYFMDFLFGGPISLNCSKYGLEIRENNSTGLQLLKACGDNLPNPIFSNSNQIYIRAYHSLVQHYFRYKFLFSSSNKTDGCGGKLFNNIGLFSSPMYPHPYRKDIECTWDVMVPKGSKVNLNFTDFNIGGGCPSNRVVVKTYKEGLETYHQFCSEDIPAPLYSDDTIKVKYYSTVHNGGPGWLAKFQATKTLGYS